MKSRAARAADLVHLLERGHSHKVLTTIGERLYGKSLSHGLCRDVEKPFAAPPAKIPLVVRRLRPTDDLSFLEIEGTAPTDGGAFTRLSQQRLLRAKLPECYVAITPEGQVCYMQWLVGARENDQIQAHFGNLFPILAKDEALLEAAFTVDSFRGMGVMPCAMAQIAERARNFGARRVITFVGENNIPSLKGCKKAGFEPYAKRHEGWRLFRRSITFAPLPPGTKYPFESAEIVLTQ